MHYERNAFSVVTQNASFDKEIWNIMAESGEYKKLDRGSIVFSKEKPNNGIVCLKKGKVKISSILRNGKEKIFGIMVAPSVFGETETFDGGPRMVTATALTTVEVNYIFLPEAKQLIESNSEIAIFLFKALGLKLRWTTLQVEDLSQFNKIPYRLAALLLDFKKYGVFTDHNDNNCLLITHDELANCINTTRPRVTTLLKRFAASGMLETKRGQIRILNSGAIQRYIESFE